MGSSQPGVTSMSADTHKYGFALKGTSVVLYRKNIFRRHQYFNVPDWPGGMYASPTASGSRSGGLTAATWAAMVYLGEEGYLKAAGAIMAVADEIKQGIAAIPELTLIGEPTFGKGTVQTLIDLNRFVPGEDQNLGRLRLTMAEFFRASGYRTGHFGKWHLGDVEESYPHNQGFDEAFFTGTAAYAIFSLKVFYLDFCHILE